MSSIHQEWKDRWVDEFVARNNAAAEERDLQMAANEAARQACRMALERAKGEHLRELSNTLDRVLHAATWLIGLGIKIRSLQMQRLPRGMQAVIRVESTPFLWRLFAGDCAWRERRTDGEQTVYTWFAIRYATRIEWEERQCLA